MSPEIEKDDNGKSYVSVPVGKIQPDLELPSSIYLKIDQKFICFKLAGDFVPGQKYNYFLEKKLKHIYVELIDLELFINWLKEKKSAVIDEIVNEVGEEYRGLAERREELKEKVWDTYQDLELDSGIVDILQDQVKEFVSEIKENEVPAMILAKLTKYNESIAEHSMNTANISVFLALNLGHGNQQVLEDIYMGALFHDYAKAKLSQSVLDNKNNFQYNQAIQDHPRKGSKVIKSLGKVSANVIKIIDQHHEQFNGKGFPNGLKGEDIFGLAQIVSIANVFDNAVVDNRQRSKKEKFRNAIKVIEYDRGKQFDPELVEKFVEPLKLGYAECFKAPVREEKINLTEDS